MVLRLWGHCQQRRKWKFDTTCEAIAAICRCENLEPRVLIDTLRDCKFLDVNNGTFVVHDWEKSNRSLISAWKNGSKGGRPLKSLENRQVTGREPVGNRPLTHPSSLSNPVQKNGETEGKDDLAWLAELRDDPAYKGIDIAREHAKATRWCKENKRQITRRFFINWLNKCDKVLEVKFRPASTTKKYYETHPERELSDEQIKQNKVFIEKQKAELAEKLRMPS